MSRLKTLLVAVILVVGILFPTTTLASPGITVSITDAVLPAGDTGSVALSISGATELVSCIDVDVTYDPAVVEVIDASGSDFDSLVSNIENGDGHTHLVAYVTSETGLTGTIKVADITLKRLGGESDLTLDVITLKDDDGNPLAYDVHNGQVSGAIGLTVSISEVTLAAGATGSVAVTISGVSSDRPVSSTTIDVSYDPAVVEVLDASGSDFDSLVSNIQNGLGYTRLVAYVTSETGLTDTIKVADIILKRLGGESALTLDVITLKDDDGEPIRFSAVDGRVIADDIRPTVISTLPANGATGVAITTRVRATFSEAIDEGTLSFSLDGVDGSVSYSGTTATFAPSFNLGYSTSYTASISASDLAGNPMVAPYSCTFTTGTVPTVPPAVTTAIATSIGTTTATLNLSLTDLGTATSVRVSFEWGETSAYGNETTPQTMTSTGSFSSSLSGLSPNTTYHFRAKAVADGTSYGIDRAFTTGTVPTVPPAVTTDPATGVITTTLATLNGSLTDLGTATAVGVSFEWGETSAYGNETTPQTMTSTGAFSSPLSGLSPDTTYHFRAKAMGDGTSYGLDRSFTTGVKKVVTIPPGQTDYVVDASDIADTTITVDTTAEVTIAVTKYATNPHPEVPLPASMLPRYIDIEVDNPDAIAWPMHVEQTYTNAEVAGINESTLGMYHFRDAVWHRCSDTGVYEDINTVWANMTRDELPGSPIAIGGTAAPEPEPPSLVTNAATSVTTSSATLNGNLGSLGTATSVRVSFEWGETSAYGNETTPQTMTSTGAFSSPLSGLSPNTTYHFRAKAVGDGTSYGIDRAFTTRARAGGGIAAPPATPPAPPPGTTDVRGQVSDAGVFLESVSATSEDGLCTLTIPEGTVGLTEELEPLTEISTLLMDEPPPPPEAAHVIGLAYDLGPDGATFDPPITLTFTYDPSDIPEGIAEEDLAIAYYDQATGEWVELEDCVVDTENNTITASVSHFTTFAIIGVVTPPPEVVPPEEEEVAPPEEEEVAPPEEEEVAPPPEEEEEVPEVPAPINWPLIGGIIAAVVVIGLIIFFSMRRRAQFTRR